MVRRNVGCACFDTAEELAVLNELYALLREHKNFFMPSAKLLSKTRDGAKVTKRVRSSDCRGDSTSSCN